MELAAVVVVPDGNTLGMREVHSHRSPNDDSDPLHPSLLPVLGNDVLQTWMGLVQKLGVPSLWLTSSRHAAREASFKLSKLAKEGVERLLVIKLKSYAEMDLTDLLRFHRERHNSITEVHDSRGHLGVSLSDHHSRPASAGHSRHSNSDESIPYAFRGYAKRISSARERQELVGDGLTGACAMRPFGTETRAQVWIGENVSLAHSARVIGPTYIGDGTIVRAGATIGPFASVERDCVVDCGTTVEQSTLLPNTYLAPGLLIRNALVDGHFLEDLSDGVVVDLRQAGLASRTPRPASDAQALSRSASHRFSRVQDNTSNPHVSFPEWRQVQL